MTSPRGGTRAGHAPGKGLWTTPLSRADVLRASLGLAALALPRRVACADDGSAEFLQREGMPYDAFDKLPVTDIAVPDGVIHVGFAPGDLRLPKSTVLDRVKQAASAVSTYYGRFPVPSVRFLIVPVEGEGVLGGTTWGYRGAAIRIIFGRDTDADELHRDWIMTHEMVHLALPDMDQRYNWLSEGLAVYVEPIARVQSGDLTAKAIWSDMKRDMPQGLPQVGDQGLDYTATWGRVYWGGALFCLLADIDMRRKTNNRLGLQDAMRGVLKAGGNHDVDWPIPRILATADAAVGLSVLQDLYEKMHARRVRPGLATIWRDLGVDGDSGAIRLDDTAPLAPLRVAITRPPSA